LKSKTPAATAAGAKKVSATEEVPKVNGEVNGHAKEEAVVEAASAVPATNGHEA